MNSVNPTSLHLGLGWFPDAPGGLNRYLRGLLEALNADRMEATAVVVGPVRRAPSYVDAPAVSSDSLPARLLAYSRAAHRNPDVDLVDAHFALYAFPTACLGRGRRLPLVVHFHGPWSLEGRASGDGILRQTVKRTVERLVYRRADEAIVLSRAFGRLLIERYGVSPWRVNVIPPGVDLAQFSPGDRSSARLELGLPDGAWIAFAVRRLVPRMGIDVLLDSWSRLPVDRGLLLIAGDGPLRSPLERRAPSGVRFIGAVNDELLRSYYRAADVSVVPSRSLEGFGLVALESLACGTPVIVTAVGGLPEVVSGLPGDVVVPRDNPAALADRLATAASGSKPLPSTSQTRAHAEQFTWPRVADRHRGVYRRAVRRGRRLPLRVVYLDHTAVLSGAELALLRLLSALDGVDAHVMLAEDGPLVQKLEVSGISVEVLPLTDAARGITRRQVNEGRVLARGTTAGGAYVFRLARRLRRFAPDLVHTNSLKSALYGGAAGRIAGIPVVWHVHDRVAPDYLGERGTRIVRLAALRVPSAVIANSHSTLASLGVPGQVIPNPIPRVRSAHRNGERPFTAGMVGRIASWKGQHVFIEAFAHAFPNGPERAFVIGAPLFGEDEHRYEDELHTLVERLGLRDRILFTGFVDDVTSWLARLDALVHASTLAEPFGQVVVEGMAAGIPVIASRAGGPAEIIEDGSTGLLYPPSDVAALAEILVRLATDPALREDLGSRARAAADNYAPDVVAAQVRDLYEGVLKRHLVSSEGGDPRAVGGRRPAWGHR